MPKKKNDPALEEKRDWALSNDANFIETIHPNRMLGNVHRDIIRWWDRPDAKSHQMLLLPREHMKSTLIAYRIARALTIDPALRILLISSTSNLAVKQLKFIKDILTSPTYRTYWPEMVNQQEATREMWTQREISVDHPKRKEEAIRDPSIFTAGLTTNVVGLHCDIAVLDDVVTMDNAYTEEGREKVRDQYGYLSSVETVGAREWVVGTRYHPKDLYAELLEKETESYDSEGNIGIREALFEIYGGDDDTRRWVESNGDGSGEYLWPRQLAANGKWYGFNWEVLGPKKLQYANQTHFRAQYYNDPHDIESSRFKRDYFQYYEPGHIHRDSGQWYYKERRLNVFAAVDFAYSLGKRADYTTIVVVGVDFEKNVYILEIDRFKTDQNIEYFNRIAKLHEKWNFRKLRAEVTGAQITIVNDIKDHVRKLGLAFSIDEYKPTKWEGAKEERIQAVLQHRYENKTIWHYPTGNIQILEEELLLSNPAHDDVKDALAAAVSVATAPTGLERMFKKVQQFSFNSRFGGVS
jgi:hypothetical protein